MALYATAAVPENNPRLNKALRAAINNYWQLNFFTPLAASQVWGVAFDPKSPDGRRAAVGDDNGVVWLWDPVDPSVSAPSASRNLQHLTAAPGVVNGLAFSADEDWLAAAYRGAGSVVWDLKTETPICSPGRSGDEGGAYGVAFHGARLAVAGNDHAVHLWDVSKGGCSRGHVFRATDVVYGVAFTPNGRRLAAASGDGTVTIWDIDAPDVPYGKFSTDDKSPAFAVAFGPDGKTLAATAANGRGYLWNIETKEQTVLRRRGGTVGQVAFSPNGKWVIATAQADGTAIVTDAGTHEELWYLGGEGQGLFGVAFSPDGNYLLTGNLNGVVGVWLMESDGKAPDDRSGLIDLGLQRMADRTLTTEECEELRELKIPIFVEADKEPSGICQLPFLWQKPRRNYPLLEKTPLSVNFAPSKSGDRDRKLHK
jgi:WD40 repeat protein